MNSPNDNNRLLKTGILFALLVLTLLQFILAQKVQQSLDHLQYAYAGFKTSAQYYDDFEQMMSSSYTLKGRVFCARREGLQFQFEFGPQMVRSWIWSVGNKKLYMAQEPAAIGGYLHKDRLIEWNINFLGRNYSFSAIAFIYPEGGSFLRGHRELMWEGPC